MEKTLRDEFALAILPSIYRAVTEAPRALTKSGMSFGELTARASYDIADAMMRERSKSDVT